jgi:asparagine synthase (glutamine-hydrolysing)
MCGLNGIFAYHPAAQTPDVKELLDTRDAMSARGPDGFGAWWSSDRRCALAHRRLSILDLSDRAAQPMMGDHGSVVVFNGEIYNYPLLRAELEAKGTVFRTSSDTEILLHLYLQAGPAMVHRLRGMFAFAIWDNRRQGLFLARDPYGIKPLYIANDGWTFRFASQVKALLAGGRVSRAPEPAGLVGFHLFGSVPEPFTLYGEIRALPAGNMQWIDRFGPCVPVCYANVADFLARGARENVSRAPGMHPGSSEADSYEIRQSLRDSVRAHLLSDVEVGIFLSAGVDSGALLGMMSDMGRRDVPAITLAFDEFRGTEEDEAPIAARIAERYGARHLVRRVSESEFAADLPALLDAMDQPSIDGVNTWFVAKAAKEAGLKVALSGLGGDELLAGYPSFVDLPRWRKGFGLLAAIPGLGRITAGLLRRVAPQFVRRRPKVLGMLKYGSSWAGLYLLRRGLFLPCELQSALDPEIVKLGLHRLKPLDLLASHLKPDPATDVGRVCALESMHYLRNQLLRDADWAGMAHGVEVRTPFVDIGVLERLAPVISRLVPGLGKVALSNAPQMPLATEVVRRQKTGFVVPTAAWMRRVTAEAKSTVQDGFESKGLASRNWSHFVFGANFAHAIGLPG